MGAKTKLSCFAAAALLAGSAFAQDIVRPGQVPRGAAPAPLTAAPNSYIVMFTPGTSRNNRANAAFFAGAAVRHNYVGMDAIAVTVPNANALDALRRAPGVTRIVPDYVVRTEQKAGKGGGKGGGGSGGGGGSTPLTFDTRQLISTEVQRVGMPVTGSDGAGIGVAVVDTGIDFNHPDLAPAPNNPQSAYNAINPNGSCQDDGGHGTHISGLIAALNNNIAIVGVAPAAKLYCVKVIGSDLTGQDSDVIAGLDWVLQNHNQVNPPIRVVNLSLGRPLDTGETLDNSDMRPIIQALYNQGVVVVASAGNDPTLEISQVVPAGFPEVLAVASTFASNGIRTCLLGGDSRLGAVPADAASGFTTDGADVTISAPGEERTDIVTLGFDCVGLEYGTLSTTLGTTGATRKLVPSLLEARGTSFSAALVSGVVARVLQKQLVPDTGDGAEVEGVRSWIKTNASRVGTAPLDQPWGNIIYTYTFDGVREGIVQAPQ
jgi:subtilisin family serine protease